MDGFEPRRSYDNLNAESTRRSLATLLDDVQISADEAFEHGLDIFDADIAIDV